MPKYYVTFSGGGFVDADSPLQAQKIVLDLAHVYGSATVREVGKEVDENGWPLKEAIVGGYAANGNGKGNA